MAAFLSLPVAGRDRETKEREIRVFFAQWEEAAEALDLDGVMSLYAPDFLQWGMSRGLHKILYRAQYHLVRRHEGRLEVSLELRDMRFADLDEDTELADVDLVVGREEMWGDERYVDRAFMPMRLRREKGEDWLLIGNSYRTLPLAQVGCGDGGFILVLTAESAYPTFPMVSLVEGPGVNNIELKYADRDVTGRPFVTNRLFLSDKPEVGTTYTFHTPYPDGVEHLKAPVRSVVTEAPEIITPPHDFDISRWPVKVEWEDVSDRIEDFNCYEVHVRRADNYDRVMLFRSLPPERTSVLLGETEEQREAFPKPHVPYLIEVYAYDIYPNFAFSRRRVYNMIGAEKEAAESE